MTSAVTVLLATAALAGADPEALESRFRELPMVARRLTGPLFWLHGDENETKERLEFYLEKVAEGGNGCFTAESRPHRDWLGPQWNEDLAKVRVLLEVADLAPEEAARVTVNGRYAGGFIGRPLRLGVTRHLASGPNTIGITPIALERARLAIVEPRGDADRNRSR